MRTVRLKEHIKQIRGVSYSPGDVVKQGGIALLRSNNIQENAAVYCDLVYVNSNRVAPDQFLRRNDILICTSNGSKALVGKACQITEDKKYSFGAFCKVIRIVSDVFNPRYLGYYFASQTYRDVISGLCQGSSINNLRNEHFDELQIPLYSSNYQEQVVAALDKLFECQRTLINELELLEELIKSRFIEMFKDKGYPIIPLKDLSSSKAEYGAGSASAPYEEGRPRYVRITDINDDGTLNDDVVCSINPQDDIDYKLSYGDFMFARMGATVGKTYAFFEGNEIYAGYLIRYKLNLNKLNPRYLFTYSKLEDYLLWVKNNQSGAAQPGISAKKYDVLPIPVAPIELQNEFAQFVKQIDKSKFILRQELASLQELIDAKMAEYFEGEGC